MSRFFGIQNISFHLKEQWECQFVGSYTINACNSAPYRIHNQSDDRSLAYPGISKVMIGISNLFQQNSLMIQTDFPIDVYEYSIQSDNSCAKFFGRTIIINPIERLMYCQDSRWLNSQKEIHQYSRLLALSGASPLNQPRPKFLVGKFLIDVDILTITTYSLYNTIWIGQLHQINRTIIKPFRMLINASIN